MGMHQHCEYNCGATDCDASEAPPRQQVASNDLLCDYTSTSDGNTHKQNMLEALHDADAWHDEKARSSWSKEKKLMHRRYQIAIWWALENLDDEAVTITVT